MSALFIQVRCASVDYADAAASVTNEPPDLFNTDVLYDFYCT